MARLESPPASGILNTPTALKRHWRSLVARYGAYPVVWIVAGEIADETKWGQGPWAEVAAYVRSTDPYHRPLTSHTAPGNGRRGAGGDVSLIDFDMVGGNHDAPTAMSAKTLAILTSARATSPPMPVLVGETCYEGHMQQGSRMCSGTCSGCICSPGRPATPMARPGSCPPAWQATMGIGAPGAANPMTGRPDLMFVMSLK